MAVKKQRSNTHAHLEKIFTLAGLALVLVGCLANLYSAHLNWQFLHEPLDFIYYLRHIILLGGGFVASYFLAGKSTRHDQLFLGVIYATLAVALSWLFDLARLGMQNLFGFPPYPWGKILFMGLPLLALVIVLVIACLSRYKTNRLSLSALAKSAIVFSFVAYQVYLHTSSVYYLLTGASTYAPNTPLWLIVSSYLATPAVVAIVSYLLLGNIKSRFDRIFYGALTGTVYSILTVVLWEFRTDASSATTDIFSGVVTAVTILFVGVLLWRARRAIK